MYIIFWLQNLKGKGQLEEIGVYRRIIIIMDLRETG
jgi:hypothetical protein